MYFLKKGKTILILVLALMLASTTLFVGCGEEEEEAKEYEIAKTEEIELAIVNWPGVTQKTYVLKEVLDNLGYETNITELTLPVILQSMVDGEIDAFAGSWFQTWGQPLQERLDDGSVIHVSTQIDNSTYTAAVPSYVYEAGVTSHEDLAEHADRFDYRYLGLEEGNDGNQVIIDAIENDTYGLGDWELIPSGEAAMMADVMQAVEEEEWVVFSGWEPHWMNVLIDMEYLDDPEEIWGEDERIGTVARADLPQEQPNLYKFLEQFDITVDIQDEWVLEYGKEGRDPDVVAEEWVNENLDLVLEWTEGVTTVDGEDAQEVLKGIYQ